MSYYSQIENALKQTDQATIEEIINKILFIENDISVNFLHIGKVPGKAKTRKGTPDIYFKLPNNYHVFVEATSMDGEKDKKKFLQKIHDDIEKCRIEAEKLKIKVSKIIYGCNSTLSVEQVELFNNECKLFCEDPNPFEFWGIDYLANKLAINNQTLANEIFNISKKSGTISKIDDISNKFDVSQTHEFLFREDEIKDIKEQLNEKFVLLYGKAGSGKSRLSIEIGRQLKSENQIYDCYIVKGSDASLLKNDLDLVSDRPVLCILDDVNRMPFLKECLNYALEHKNVKVIATVRDYAFQSIVDDLTRFEMNHMVVKKNIEPLNHEQQGKILYAFLNKKSNKLVQEVLNVSAGNLRFAIMCAEVINEGKEVPITIQGILNEHFTRVNNDLIDLKESKEIKLSIQDNYKKALLYAALRHRVIDLDGVSPSRNSSLQFVTESLEISREDFIEAMLFWEEKEIINISQNNKIFEISDQILANFLFYKLVFKERLLTLTELFEKSFINYRSRIVEMFQSLIPIYGHEDTDIKTQLDDAWRHYKEKDNNETVQFIETFFSLIPEESLIYMSNKIKENNDHVFIKTLLFARNLKEYYTVAIDMLIQLLRKSDFEAAEIKNISESFIINEYDWDILKLSPQIYILQKLKENLNNENCKKLYIELIKELFKFQFSYNKTYKNTMQIINLEVVESDFLYEMRKEVFNGIVVIYEKDKDIKSILTIVNSNQMNPIYLKHDKFIKIIENDKNIVLDILKRQEPSTLTDYVFIKILLNCVYHRNNKEYLTQLKYLFSKDRVFNLYSLIEDYKILKENNYAINKNEIMYEKFYKNFETSIIIDYICFEYEIVNNKSEIGLFQLFKKIIHEEPQNSLKYLNKLFDTVRDIKFPNTINLDFYDLFEMKNNHTDIYKIIKESNINEKNTWLLAFFQNISQNHKELINESYYNDCKKLFNHNNPNMRYYDIYMLLSFEEYKKGFVVELFEMFVKYYADGNVNSVAYELFYAMNWERYGKTDLSVEKIEEYFGDKTESLYYETYFKLIGDHHSMASNDFAIYLGKKNTDYLLKYYYKLFNSRSMWLKGDIVTNFDNKIQLCVDIFIDFFNKQLEEKKYFGLAFMWNISFSMEKILNTHEFKEFTNIIINSKVKDYELFIGGLNQMIKELTFDYQSTFYKALIEYPISKELFKKLSPFEVNHWSGSTASMYEETLKKMEKFLKDFPIKMENLEYIEVIKDRINNIKTYIPRARLIDIEDFDF